MLQCRLSSAQAQAHLGHEEPRLSVQQLALGAGAEQIGVAAKGKGAVRPKVVLWLVMRLAPGYVVVLHIQLLTAARTQLWHVFQLRKHSSGNLNEQERLVTSVQPLSPGTGQHRSDLHVLLLHSTGPSVQVGQRLQKLCKFRNRREPHARLHLELTQATRPTRQS